MVDYRIVGIIKCQKVFFLGTKLPAKNARVTVWQCWVQKYHTFRCLFGLREEKDSPAATIIFKTRDKICNM